MPVVAGPWVVGNAGGWQFQLPPGARLRSIELQFIKSFPIQVKKDHLPATGMLASKKNKTLKNPL
jgi:hypothetical protein